MVAADSMGVRSLATVVEVGGLVVGVDLGASLAPIRYGLPPHELEYERLAEALEEAEEWLRESSIVVITHYHYDHYMSERPELYAGKTLLVKNPRRSINRSQAVRSYVFLKKMGVEEKADVRPADGGVFEFEGVTLEFSQAVWHGEPGTKVGRLVMVRISSPEGVVVYASDVQGPGDPEALKQLLSWRRPRPNLVILGGPPTYFEGFKVSVKAVEAGLENMMRVVREVKPRTLIVDHHLLRDLHYRERIRSHLEAARESGVDLVTAAEYMGEPVNQLEARRRELWSR